MERKTRNVIDLLFETGEFSSKSEIRRLLKQNAVWIKVEENDDLFWGEERLFKIGKRKFIKII